MATLFSGNAALAGNKSVLKLVNCLEIIGKIKHQYLKQEKMSEEKRGKRKTRFLFKGS